MERIKYKFEAYNDRSFPVYSNMVTNRHTLVSPIYHEEAEFSKVLSGNVIFRAGTKNFCCHPGDIVFLPPFTIHEAVVQPDAALQEIPDDGCIQALVFHTKILQQPVFYHLPRGSFYLFKKEHPLYQKLDALLTQAFQTYAQNTASYKLEMTGYLFLLAGLLSECDILSYEDTNPASNRLQPALDYIAHHYAEPIHLSDLASVLCVCEDHVIRLFKASTGKTPAEYLTDYRITEAMKLLASDTCSIAEIADRLAFSNPSHFSKVFREKLHMSPSEYRKRGAQIVHKLR